MSSTLEAPPLAAARHVRPLRLALGLVALALLFAAGLDHPIQDNNEGLYGRIAWEMLESGRWIIPTLDGVPYMEKPPMLYWVTALAYAVLGVGEAASRVAPMAGLALTLGAVFVFARRRWDERTAITAACIVASAPLFVGMSRMLMFDMLFTGFYAWAVVALHEALAGSRRRAWIRLAYAALALAVLTKGLLALVLFGALALGLVAFAPGERRARLRTLADPWALALFFLVAAPWHVMAAREEPHFAWYYFWHEHVLRFLDRREPHDYYHGSPWYYLPRVVGSMLPWIVVLLLPARADADRGPGRFLWAAFLVPLAFFSLSAAKANYYMLLALPMLALLLARRIVLLRDGRWLALVPLLWIALFATLVAAGPRLARPAQWPAAGDALAAAALAIALLSCALAWVRRPLAASVASAAVALPLALLVSQYFSTNEDVTSARGLALDLERAGMREVYLFRDFENLSSLPWYVRRPIGVIDSASNELWYGMRIAPDAERFPSATAFADSPRRFGAAVVVMEAQRAALEASVLGPHLVRAASRGRVHFYRWRDKDSVRQVTGTRSAESRTPRG